MSNKAHIISKDYVILIDKKCLIETLTNSIEKFNAENYGIETFNEVLKNSLKLEKVYLSIYRDYFDERLMDEYFKKEYFAKRFYAIHEDLEEASSIINFYLDGKFSLDCLAQLEKGGCFYLSCEEYFSMINDEMYSKVFSECCLFHSRLIYQYV